MEATAKGVQRGLGELQLGEGGDGGLLQVQGRGGQLGRGGLREGRLGCWGEGPRDRAQLGMERGKEEWRER